MFIQNCAAYQIDDNSFINPGDNSMLIQILDLDTNFPIPVHNFRETHQFRFLDIEDTNVGAEEFGITDQQAAQIYGLLKHALTHKMNVIVHCQMGVCRSGAVTEAGVVMGFEDTGKWRQPNLRVKRKLFNLISEDMK